MAFKIFKAKKKVILGAVAGGILLIALITGILVWQLVDWDKEEDSNEGNNDYYLEPSDSELGIYSKAAVATDAPECSRIGRLMLDKNGSAADAIIAAALCVGVVQTQSMGLGGGFIAIYYNAEGRNSTAIIARDRAPYKASENMFHGDPEKSARGPLSIGIPGELKGYWEMHVKYGKLPWKELFEPTIQLAENGFNVTQHAANAMRSQSVKIRSTPSLREVFVNNETGQVFREGDWMRRPVLAKTLRIIADAPEGDLLYRDSQLMRDFVDDVQNMGGLITERDMLDYKVTWDESPVKVDMAGDLQIHSIPPPASGVLLGFLFRVLSHFKMSSEDIISTQRIIEAFKHAYAKRTILADPEDLDIADEIHELVHNLTVSEEYLNSVLEKIYDDRTFDSPEYYGAEFYQPEDHGTSHLSVIAPNGDAIGLTSTVNLYFGSLTRSRRTGIVYNDGMDDFASPNVTNSFGVPPSKNNFIRPHKRPVSSMAPAIFTDKNGKVRLVIGGAGGTKITTAITTVAVKNLWFGENIKEAIDSRRFHHQLYPMVVEYEEGYNPRTVEELQRIGHNTTQFNVGASVIQAIAVAENGTIYANADFRKRGGVDGF